MRLSSWAASLLIHSAVLTAVLIPSAGAGRRLPPPPRPVPIKLALVELAKLQAIKPKPAPGTVPWPKKKPVAVASSPAPRPTPTPAPSPTPKVAARPSPSPTPVPSAPPKDKKVFDALRQYSQYAGLTDEQIRKMPLPPGMKDWASVLAMTQDLDKLDWTTLPPDTGDKQASGSTGGFFGWAPAGVGQNSEYMGAASRQLVNGKWQFAFQYFGTVMVAEWADGATSARVAYYPYGGKPDPAKVFDIAVKPEDTELSAEMIAQYTLIAMGQSPAPLPTAVSAR